MGIFINLHIVPSRIHFVEWESVYNESVELVDTYPFLDKIVDPNMYEYPWVYVDRTRERLLGSHADGQLGWHTIGDELSLQHAESFILLKDLHYYRRQERKDQGIGGDILFPLLNRNRNMDAQVQTLAPNCVEVFYAKTQGHPYHLYVLAVACLIESRFPQHAMVTGDVTLGQMQEAIGWANSILQRPVRLTDRADNKKLLARIAAVLPDEAARLEAFMEAALQAKNRGFGDFLRDSFSPEVLIAYFTGLFGQHQPGMVGFKDTLREYLNLGFRLEEACDLCVLQTGGCRYDAAKFAKTVLELGWRTGDVVPDDNIIDIAINHPHAREPETIPSLVAKTLAAMAGLPKCLETDHTYEKAVEVLRCKLGKLCSVDRLRKEHEDTVDEEWRAHMPQEEPPGAAYQRAAVVHPSYDIEDLDSLMIWTPDQTLHPKLVEFMAHVKSYVEDMLNTKQDMFDGIGQKSERERIQILINANRDFYLHRRTWDFVKEHIEDIELIKRVAAILLIQAYDIKVNKLCKALLNNVHLLQTYIL